MNYVNVVIAIKNLCKNWVSVILSKVIKIPIKYIILKNGTMFSVDKIIGKADLSMFAEIWQWEFYNPPFFKIKKTDTIIDIGANNGYFTVYAAKLASSGSVYSFEPAPNLYKILEDNVKINKLANVKMYNLGVSSTNSEFSFFLSKIHNGCHSLYRRLPNDEEIKIKTINLETILLEREIDKIDLLKLDCEGAEYDIILNCKKEILNKINRITMEYHDDITNHNHIEIVDFLENNNFLVSKKNGYIYAINLKQYAHL